MFREDLSCYILPRFAYVDFLSYWGAFSLQKWRAFTNTSKYSLTLRIRGHFRLGFLLGTRTRFSEYTELSAKEYVCRDITDLSIPLPEAEENVILVSFFLEALDFGGADTEIYSACYEGEADRIRPVSLAIVTTTFHKEAFVLDNIDVIKTLGDINLRFHIVDNGGTLGAEELSGGRVTVYPNKNTGGAGGFARGMIEVLRTEEATHLLLTDDDVILLPESLRRTYTLLSLLKDEYQGHFISGAMLPLENMNLQHEDVGRVCGGGHIEPLKPRLDLSRWEDVVLNEAMPTERRGSRIYGAWWFCCMPMNVVSPQNLPLPLFIRFDDAEFSLRNNARFITMNGICVLHPAFERRYNPALDLYMSLRNCLIIQAASGVCRDVSFTRFAKRQFALEIKRLNYNAAGLILDAVEDFLCGPEWLIKQDGAALIKQKSAGFADFAAIETFETDVDISGVYDDIPTRLWRRWADRLTYNGHLLPQRLLKTKPVIIPHDGAHTPGKIFRARNVLAVDVYNKTAQMRTMDKKRFRKLLRRKNKIFARYNRTRVKTERAYASAQKRLTSEEFWREYLGLY